MARRHIIGAKGNIETDNSVNEMSNNASSGNSSSSSEGFKRNLRRFARRRSQPKGTKKNEIGESTNIAEGKSGKDGEKSSSSKAVVSGTSSSHYLRLSSPANAIGHIEKDEIMSSSVEKEGQVPELEIEPLDHVSVGSTTDLNMQREREHEPIHIHSHAAAVASTSHFDAEVDTELDVDVGEFFQSNPEMEDDSDHDHDHLRPPSASSIASFSSVFKKIQASSANVFQETSTVLNEVIKHTTKCIGGNENSNHQQHGSGAPGVLGLDAATAGLNGAEDVRESWQHLPYVSASTHINQAPIPLRHIQSSPTQSLSHLTFPSSAVHLGKSHGSAFEMKRSVSTPPAFQQSRKGSAFGRVSVGGSVSEILNMNNKEAGGGMVDLRGHGIYRGNSLAGISSTMNHGRPAGRQQFGSGSAFQPVRQQNNNHNHQPLPLCRAISLDDTINSNDGDISVTSSTATSVVSSTSIMTAKAQSLIKARRRRKKKAQVFENFNTSTTSKGSDNLNKSEDASVNEVADSIEKMTVGSFTVGTGISGDEHDSVKDNEFLPSLKSQLSTPEAEMKSVQTPTVSNVKMIKKLRLFKKKKQVEYAAMPVHVDVAGNAPSSVVSTPISKLVQETVSSGMNTPGNNSETNNPISFVPFEGDSNECARENDEGEVDLDDVHADENLDMSREEDDFLTELRGKESPSPIPPPAYQQINDDDIQSPSTHGPPLPSQPRRRAVRSPSTGNGSRLVLPLGNRSPCSQDSSSFSKSSRSGHSLNTSLNSYSQCQSNTSCSRSVTSSVAEADREVRDTNRKELRRFVEVRETNRRDPRRYEMVDNDGTQSIQSIPSIQSSDTTSTNPHAYLALNSSGVQLRDGANMQIDRFFARNGSGVGAPYGPSIGSGSISGGQIQKSSLHPPPMSGTGGRPPAMNARSPNTVSSNSNSIGLHSTSTVSTGEEPRPPSFINTKLSGGKVVPVAPSPNDDVGYSRLGPGPDAGMSSSSSKSSSMSSKSSSSKSKRRNKTRFYQKMRASTRTPSPCNSFQQVSPVKTPLSPPNEFMQQPLPTAGIRRPDVRRHCVNHIPILVSPDARVSNNMGYAPAMSSVAPEINQYSFQPSSRGHGVVTPEKRTIEEHISRFRR